MLCQIACLARFVSSWVKNFLTNSDSRFLSQLQHVFPHGICVEKLTSLVHNIFATAVKLLVVVRKHLHQSGLMVFDTWHSEGIQVHQEVAIVSQLVCASLSNLGFYWCTEK